MPLRCKKPSQLHVPYYCKRHKGFHLDELSLEGGNQWLKKNLYPHYQYSTKGLAVEQTEASASVSEAKDCESRKRKRGQSKGGLKRGKTVDEQMAYWVNHKGQLPYKKHRFTLRLIDAFKQWGWIPVAAQYVVASASRRLGTAIDFICRHKDATGKNSGYLLVELKTGFSKTWKLQQGMLQPPLQNIASCPLYHAYLQLALGYALLDQGTKAKIDPSQLYIVRIDSESIMVYRVPPWAHQAIKTLGF